MIKRKGALKVKDLKDIIENVKNDKSSDFDNFPDIELYMDQVIACMAKQNISFSDGENLTPAMINNYIKAGLLPRANGKRYTREHLAYLSMIFRLKQVLSVKETDTLLKDGMKEKSTGEYYRNFIGKTKEYIGELSSELDAAGEDAIADMALSAALKSYIYKTAAEYLIAKIDAENSAADEKAKKEKKEKDKEKKEKDKDKDK